MESEQSQPQTRQPGAGHTNQLGYPAGLKFEQSALAPFSGSRHSDTRSRDTLDVQSDSNLRALHLIEHLFDIKRGKALTVTILTVSEKPKILVADDSGTIRALLKTALEGAGYEVDMADDGLSAYELGRNAEYDLIIMDQLMPGLLGLEVIERWRDEGMEAPVLMLTGVDDDRTAVESFDLGAVDYVRKPFRMTELMARIRKRL